MSREPEKRGAMSGHVIPGGRYRKPPEMEAEFAWWSDGVAYRFKSLTEVWRRECAHLSSIMMSG